ncbi:hypothetical protein, partial [Pectobacterium parvum]
GAAEGAAEGAAGGAVGNAAEGAVGNAAEGAAGKAAEDAIGLVGSAARSIIKNIISVARSITEGVVSVSKNAASGTEDVVKVVVGVGSISRVYDIGDGYVEKEYNGSVDKQHQSRLISAKNNVNGFDRMYGKGAGELIIHERNGVLSVSAKLIKIEGYALNNIQSISSNDLLNEMKSAIEDNDISTQLANSLQKKGITHHDINKGNIIYDNKEFFILDFDSANILPEGEMVSLQQTEAMKNKFEYVFSDVLRDIKKKLSEHDTDSLKKSSDIGGINFDKTMVKLNLREWNELPSHNVKPPKIDSEENEIPQIWPSTGMHDGIDANIDVGVGCMETVTDSTTILSTGGLSDCSALIVLSDWNAVSYGSRTLVHLNGSNVSFGLKYGADASGLISELRNKIVGGGKVILVGGDQSQSDMSLSFIIAQTNKLGEKPLYELVSTLGISLTIASSAQVTVYPDGTFNLGDIEDRRGVLTKENVSDILSYVRILEPELQPDANPS